MIKKEWNVLNKSPGTDIIKSTLAARGIKDMVHFLQPRVEDLLPLTDLLNVVEAGDIVMKAIKEDKRIHVFGDIDSDGIAAMTLGCNYLCNHTDKVTWSLNSGKKHGLKFQDLQSYVGRYDLVIAVDSSSEQFEEQKFLADNGIDVVILDHHEIDKEDPGYATIVNCTFGNYGNRYLSGSGVVFKFVKYLDSLLGTEFAEDYYDLATVGIIGDMMKVGEESPENRFICSQGFKRLVNPALKAIIGDYAFNSTAVSFSVAPLVNSAMRLNRGELAAQLFLETDKKVIKKLIAEMKELKEIQNIQKDKLVDQLTFTIKANELEKSKIIALIIEDRTEDMQADIAGLSANILASQYGMPVMIVHRCEKEGILRGSCRSVGLENYRSLVNASKLVIFASGHNEAFGIELYENNWDKLVAFMNKKLAKVEFVKTSSVDVILRPEQITTDLIKKMEYINMISGTGFPSIKVAIENIEALGITSMQQKHLKFSSGDIEFVKWGGFGELENFKSNAEGIYKTCDVLGTMGMSKFRGKISKQMVIQDTRNFQDNLEFLRN